MSNGNFMTFSGEFMGLLTFSNWSDSPNISNHFKGNEELLRVWEVSDIAKAALESLNLLLVFWREDVNYWEGCTTQVQSSIDIYLLVMEQVVMFN